MKRIGRYIAGTAAIAIVALTATAPAQAVYDSSGKLVAIILTDDGEVYY